MSSSSNPVKLCFNLFEPTNGLKIDSPIIFLHGITASKEHWNEIPQIVADSTGRKVYAVDARNHGDSEWNDEFSFDINIVDTIHFIEELKVNKVIIVGHSMGGVTAMKVALKIPDKVEKIIIEDMGVRKPKKERLGLIKLYLQLAQTAVQSIPSGTSEDDAKLFIGDYIYDHLPDEIKTFVTRQRSGPHILLKQNADGSYRFRTNLQVLIDVLSSKEDISEDPKGIYNGPTLFIYGKKSPLLVGQDQELIKSYFPSAQFVGIEDANHSVHTDAPVPFTEALLNFL